jgi:PAS domain S-box-containing protein
MPDALRQSPNNFSMEGKLKILFNEDVKLDAELLWRELANNEIDFKKLLVDNRIDFIEGLKSFNPDLIISDYSIPQFTGMQALIIRNEISPLTPFILVTGSNNETVAVDCMKAGADDYILKDNLSRLAISVNNSINRAKVLREKYITEELLRQSEEKYRSIFENVQDVFYETAPDGTILEASPSIEVLSRGQYKREELLGKSINDFYSHSEERNLFMEALKTKGSVTDFEIMLKNRDGSLIPCSVSSKISFNAEGIPVKISGSMRDISERKKAERTLLDIIDNNPMSIQIMDIDGFTLRVNQAFIKLFGSVPPPDFSMFSDIQLKEKGFTELLVRIKNCEVVQFPDMVFNPHDSLSEMPDCLAWIKAVGFALLDGNGKPEKIVLMHENITERKQAEEKLRQSSVFNESLLKTIPFGMDIVDEEGNVLFLSENFKRLLGDEAIGKKCWEIYRDDKKQCSDCPLFKGIVLGETETYESHGVLDNRIFEISHTGMMFDGKKALLEIFQDITDRKQSEEELIKAKDKAEEGDRLKTAFLHNISHEIRTPMNAIVGFSALLGEPDLDAHSRTEYIEVILQSSNHLLSIITDIIDISNIEANIVKIAKNEININSTLKTLCDQFLPVLTGKNLQLVCENRVPDSAALIITDSTKLKQIITNLLSNAVKYTDKGSVKLGCEVKDKFLEFHVSDTGIGISEEHHNKIFDRFYQVESSDNRLYEGTGLGLAISSAYVGLLGGKMWLLSEPGKGTTFNFTLPYQNNVAEFQTNIEKPVYYDLVFKKKIKILVAEDVESNFLLISYFLQGANAELLRARTGREAVEQCLADRSIDLILMDIKMPDMDGYTAAKLIREANISIPIIAQTAYADDMNKAIDSGCSGFISKPFDKKGLLYKISEFIV